MGKCYEQSKNKVECVEFNKDNVSKLFESMNTEWDRKVPRMSICTSRSRKELKDLEYIITQLLKQLRKYFLPLKK